jgi:hypothetical protein
LLVAVATVAQSAVMPSRGLAAAPSLPTFAAIPTTPDSVPYGSNDPGVSEFAARGYVQEEFFISGTIAGMPYTTRLLVRRPADPRRFSGIIVAESIRSTASRSMWGVRAYLMRRGHAYVEIGSNRLAILKLVKPSNPTRYAALVVPDPHPGHLLFGHVHEIVAQAGLLLKTNPPGGPFAGFQVTRVVLAGCSEQGLFVKMYMRDSHTLYRTAEGRSIYDGYFPACVADWPDAVRLDNGTIVKNFASPPVDVPVINFTTQGEPEGWAQNGRLYRRPDSDAPGDRFRLYEVAGMPHGVDTRRTSGTVTCNGPQQASRFPGAHLVNSALDKLIRWVDEGVVPPRAERLATGAPAGPILKDTYGNALGGIRSTYVDVPIATYETCSANPLAGFQVPFSAQRLAELYSSGDAYVRAVNRRVDELVREGWYLEEDADDIRADAVEIAKGMK